MADGREENGDGKSSIKTKKNNPNNKDCLNFLQGLNNFQHGYGKPSFPSQACREKLAENILVQKDFEEFDCDLPGFPRSTYLMAFSADGTMVASTHNNHNIYVTDLRSGKNIAKLTGHTRSPWCIAFHPTSNEIVASGCLAGQVRIWDLSGGSEVWSAGTGNSIASIAFHPNERVLVIATLNEIHFWDWSRAEPFLSCSTGNPKEKVRYVAFDRLGQKLITGIANSPQQRWERVRAPVPIPRQAETSANPYRRRITPRLLLRDSVSGSNTSHIAESLASAPERERRVTVRYRNLVREYEHLVNRFLQEYRNGRQSDGAAQPTPSPQTAQPAQPSPVRVDRGTDPVDLGNSTTYSDPRLSGRPPAFFYNDEPALDLTVTNQTEPLATSSPRHSTQPELNNMALGSLIRAATSALGSASEQANSTDDVQNARTLPGSAFSPFVTISSVTTPSTSTASANSQAGRSSQAQDSPSETRTCECFRGKPPAQDNSSEASTSNENCTVGLVMPSKIVSAVRKPFVMFKGTQTDDSRKHKASEGPEEPKREKRAKTSPLEEGSTPGPSGIQQPQPDSNLNPTESVDTESPIPLTKKPRVVPESTADISASGSSNATTQPADSLSGVAAAPSTGTSMELARAASVLARERRNTKHCIRRLKRSLQTLEGIRKKVDLHGCRSQALADQQEQQAEPSSGSSRRTEAGTEPSQGQSSTNGPDFFYRTMTSSEGELRSRMLPFPDMPESMRLYLNEREPPRLRNRNTCPPLIPRRPRRHVIDTITSSESTSSDSDHSDTSLRQSPRSPPPLHETAVPITTASSASATDSSTRVFNDVEHIVSSLMDEIHQNGNNTRDTTSGTTGQETQENPPPTSSWFRRSTQFTTWAVLDRLLQRRYNTSATTATTTATSSTSTTTSTTLYGRSVQEFIRNLPPPLYSESRIRQTESATTTSSTVSTTQTVGTSPSILGAHYILPQYTMYRTTSINIEPQYTTAAIRRPTFSESDHRRWPIMTPSIRSRAFTGTTPSSSSSAESSSQSTSELVARTLPTREYGSTSARTRADILVRRAPYRPLRFRMPPYSSLQRARVLSMVSPRESSFGMDELVNYSERDSFEDDPLIPSAATPQSPTNNDPPQEAPPPIVHDFRSITVPLPAVDSTINVDVGDEQNSQQASPRNNHTPTNAENIGSMYSNIVHDLESSLNDVRNIHASSRPGETSNMLTSFSERLENIMNQSDTILRNIRTSMDMLPSTSADMHRRRNLESELRYFIRTDGTAVDASDPPRSNPITSDHTYPRNLETNNMSPLMAGLQLTVVHIQNQARLLRQQVESIERIDRAMLEVAQLQLIKELISELVRHVQSVWGENPSTGVSSVRQMMAGTRISDNSPNDSPSEDNSQPTDLSSTRTNTAGTGSGSTQLPSETSYQPSTSGQTSGESSSTSSAAAPGRPRHSVHKTYPPSRTFRFQRQCRRTCVVQLLSRRQIRSPRQTLQDLCNPIRPPLSNYASMTRRLEYLLQEQVRQFTSPQSPITREAHANTNADLGEHVIILRLHSCLLRLNRVINNSVTNNALRNFQSENSAVSQDGISRYSARQTLSLIIDELCHDFDDMSSTTLPMQTRLQIQGILAMSLLLCELLLLQIVDSIPPPTGMTLDSERESLTTRIEQMCTEILENRVSNQSNQLTRSLRLMRLTMRHASDALGQTYSNRRNAMLTNRHNADRRELIGSINRCLRTLSRRFSNPSFGPGEEILSTNQNASSSTNQNASSATNQSASSPTNQSASSSTTQSASSQTPSTSSAQPPSTGDAGVREREHFTTLRDLIARYSNTIWESNDNNPSNSNQQSTGTGAASNASADSAIEDSDTNDDDTEPPPINEFAARHRYISRDIYRGRGFSILRYNPPDNNSSNNMNNSSSSSTNRPVNVPSVHVNDVPVTEPSTMTSPNRYMSHRSRFAERVSELRASPSIFYRPRFLHPFYAAMNPFDGDLDDAQREHIYDGDMVTASSPNYRIQAWDVSNGNAPVLSSATKNVVVGDCKIHNDASVDISKDGTILVTLLPSNEYLSLTNKLGVYSLRWETLGQCLYITSFDQNAVSVSLSPTASYLVVGVASRRTPLMLNERFTMARFLKIDDKLPKEKKVLKDKANRNSVLKDPAVPDLETVRLLPHTREQSVGNPRSLNCIRFLPVPGQGLVYGTNLGELIILS